MFIYILRLRQDKGSNRRLASLTMAPRIVTGTFSRMREMEDPKLIPWLGLALTRIIRPKCNQYSSKLDSLLKTQTPLWGLGGETRGLAWVPGSPGVPLGSGHGWTCLRRN